MNKTIAIALAGGSVLVLLPLCAYLAALRLGWHLDILTMLAFAGFLAAGLSASAFLYQVLSKPNAGPVYVPSPLTAEPVNRFVSLFDAPNTIPILARPNIPAPLLLQRYGRIFEHPENHSERKVLLKIKKSKRPEDVFNPVQLRDLFDKIKPFAKSEHMLLLNEHDEFIGYIPFATAIKDFTGDQAETKIRNAVVNVLANPTNEKSINALRTMGGMAVDDFISEQATIRDAAKMVWGEPYGGKPLNGLPPNGVVLYGGKRNRKPIGVLTEKGLLQLVATGA